MNVVELLEVAEEAEMIQPNFMAMFDPGLPATRKTVYRVFYPLYFAEGRYRMSVQAAAHCYCTPRDTVALDEYTHFEVMLNVPRADIPEAWNEYYSDPIHSYVPVELINDLIAKLHEKYGLCI